MEKLKDLKVVLKNITWVNFVIQTGYAQLLS